MEREEEEKGDPFLINYSSTDLRTASEFLSNWLPFLSKDLCQHCSQTLSDRIRSIVPAPECDEATEPLNKESPSAAFTSKKEDYRERRNWGDEEEEKVEMNDLPDLSSFQAKEPLNKECNSGGASTSNNEVCNDDGDMHSIGSWGDAEEEKGFQAKEKPTSNNEVCNDDGDMHSIGSWGDAEEERGFQAKEKPTSNNSSFGSKTPLKKEPTSNNQDSYYASEDDFEVDDDEEEEVHREVVKGHSRSGETMRVRVLQNAHLSKQEKKYNRFINVKREMDYICLERVEGKIVNILDGLELHTGVFSASEQTKIVDFVLQLQEMGKNSKGGNSRHWQRGKRRVTYQFGCLYNYGFDKRGNPPGILRDVIVDPLPKIFKTMIKRLIKWHVVPPTCIPDSCTVHVYEEGDSIPPHIDNFDFLRPFCTVSFLSECSMVFGSNMLSLGTGDYSGSYEISLPVGSVVVLNGNSSDVSKHCIPFVPAKRISITFRKMDESRRPTAYKQEHDLQRIQPLHYENTKSRWQKIPNSRPFAVDKQQGRRVGDGNREGSYTRENVSRSGYGSLQIQRGQDYTRRVRVNPDRYD